MGFHITGDNIEVKTEDGWKHLKKFDGSWIRGTHMRTLMGVDRKDGEEFDSPVAKRGLPDDVTEETLDDMYEPDDWGQTWVSSSDLEEHEELKELTEFEDLWNELESKSEEYEEVRAIFWNTS